MIVPRYHEDLSVLHDNTMPARSYYVPASKRMDDLVEHRELSDRMQMCIRDRTGHTSFDKNEKQRFTSKLHHLMQKSV